MEIFFPEEAPEFSGTPPEIRFTVLVDGEEVVCAISAEALSDHFDAAGPFEEAMLAAFHAGRHKIFSVCRAALERSAGHPVILRSGIFRFASASGQA
ncbi:DUF1488 domain-containing protein [Robbsia sp. Bb-Pol-6]|uniref:DUF1488 domain-containing protein n=1 Tax=Robbsia betulipollinis TaxID=2981849 RepID=A0ABT3ZM56_9BURK|nr:DUF1488 domain-containing protein [Robbsia betulipollinis]MCY0387636.1 DUF1488 domain-containing protein [Robbsia betulipollinis]